MRRVYIGCTELELLIIEVLRSLRERIEQEELNFGESLSELIDAQCIFLTRGNVNCEMASMFHQNLLLLFHASDFRM